MDFLIDWNEFAIIEANEQTNKHRVKCKFAWVNELNAEFIISKKNNDSVWTRVDKKPNYFESIPSSNMKLNQIEIDKQIIIHCAKRHVN